MLTGKNEDGTRAACRENRRTESRRLETEYKKRDVMKTVNIHKFLIHLRNYLCVCACSKVLHNTIFK